MPSPSQLGFGVFTTRAGPECRTERRSGLFPSGTTVVNGVGGITFEFPQWFMEQLVDDANLFSPGCNFTRADFELGELVPLGPIPGPLITSLDAAGIRSQ